MRFFEQASKFFSELLSSLICNRTNLYFIFTNLYLIKFPMKECHKSFPLCSSNNLPFVHIVKMRIILRRSVVVTFYFPFYVDFYSCQFDISVRKVTVPGLAVSLKRSVTLKPVQT